MIDYDFDSNDEMTLTEDAAYRAVVREAENEHALDAFWAQAIDDETDGEREPVL